jgi:signal transduction histidine kinase
MKLFPKLALMVSGLLLGTVLCIGFSYYWAEERDIRNQAKLDEQRVLQNLTHIAEESFLTGDDLLLVKYVLLLPKWNPTMAEAGVIDSRGKIRAHSVPQKIGHIEKDHATKRAFVIILSQNVRMGAGKTGTASVSFSQQKLNEELNIRLAALRKRISGLTCTGLLISLAGCFLMALSWTRPVQILSEGARQVGDGKLKLDLNGLTERSDELGFLARAFSDMAFKLEELDRMKEDFVSAVTHELRSPLGAIESFLNLIDHKRAQGIPEDRWRDYLQRIRLNTQRLTRFVNDLLDVSALERGKITVNKRSTDAGAAAKDVLLFFEAKMSEKGISGVLQCPNNLPKVWADQDHIMQVLINLVGNAVKFTPQGGHVEISLEHMSFQKMLRICVADTGIGISDKDQLIIFNKFEQVHSARTQVQGPKGTGLGLAICRELVKLQGGEIGVTSRLGQGSTFFFTLPTAQLPVHAPG